MIWLLEQIIPLTSIATVRNALNLSGDRPTLASMSEIHGLNALLPPEKTAGVSAKTANVAMRQVTKFSEESANDQNNSVSF